MKKLLIISMALVVAIATLGFTGLAYAQGTTPPAVPDGQGTYQGFGQGRMNRGGGMRGGFAMSGQVTADGYSPLHEYMMEAMAAVLGTDVETLEARRLAGETLWDIAESEGISADDFRSLLIEARSEAINQASEDGLLTEAQAGWMNSRMSRAYPEGYGPGSANCDGSGQLRDMRGGRGGRWSAQPTVPAE